MNRSFAVLPLAAVVALAGCGVSSDESVAPSPSPYATFKAAFVPLGGVMPFPNDLFFSGTVDGTLNIPVVDPTDVSDPLNALDALDGYSTVAPIFVPTTGQIDASSITPTSVVMIDVTNAAAPVPLTPTVDFSVGVSSAADGGNVLTITPLHPLNPKSRYGVIVMRTITDGTNGLAPDDAFQNILDARAGGTLDPSLTAVKAAIDPLLDGANAFSIPDAAIAIAFTFATQSTSDVLDTVSAGVTAQASAIGPTGVTNKDILDPTHTNPAIYGFMDVYAGFVEVPYYLDKTAVLTGHWHGAGGSELTQYNPTPVATSTEMIPVLVMIPNASSPSAGVKPVTGWPVLIFQHGITGNRTQALAIADAAANAGFAVVSIDQPLHGLPDGHPLLVPGVGERTFDVDFLNNTTGAPGADGVPDTSGANYINLTSLLTSRDNLRESAADLMSLAATIPTINYDATAGGDFDGSRIHFLGHSLGGIVGATFLGASNQAGAGVLAMPGGGVANLLRDSATFGPIVNAGLASAGVVSGTQLYEAFMQEAQTAVDSGDPLNYAATAAANHPILMFQVVGDGAANLPDQVVPNSATQRLADAMGLTRYSSGTTFSGSGVRGLVNFTAGGHGSVLDPSSSVNVTVEMQTEMANFIGSDGAALVITDTSVVQP